MKSESFIALTTAEISPPEAAADPGAAGPSAIPLPRSLAERAGRARSKRRAILLVAVLVAVVGLEILALGLLGRPRPLLVYREAPPAADARP